MRFISYLEIVAGAALIFFVQNKVAHMLGYLLIFVGLSYVILNEEIQFDLDENNKVINWQKKKLFKKTIKTVPFKDIKRVFVQRVGKADSFTEFYCISLELQNGDIINSAERFTSEAKAESTAHHLRNLLL